MTKPVALIVDSPHAFRDWLHNALSKKFAVHLTTSGREALRLADQYKPPLIFISAFLEDIMGFEVIESIRNRHSPNTKIILIGAIFRAYRLRSAPQKLYGADAYIEEGVTENGLSDILNSIFAPFAKPHIREEKQPEAGETIDLEEARTLARLIISDIYIYHPIKARRAILKGQFTEAFAGDLKLGLEYFHRRVPKSALKDSDVFTETLQEFLTIKRKEFSS